MRRGENGRGKKGKGKRESVSGRGGVSEVVPGEQTRVVVVRRGGGGESEGKRGVEGGEKGEGLCCRRGCSEVCCYGNGDHDIPADAFN